MKMSEQAILLTGLCDFSESQPFHRYMQFDLGALNMFHKLADHHRICACWSCIDRTLERLSFSLGAAAPELAEDWILAASLRSKACGS